MSKYDVAAENGFKSFAYIFLDVFLLKLLHNLLPINFSDYSLETFGSTIRIIIDSFSLLFISFACIIFAVKAIYKMWLFFYYLFFYSNKYSKMCIKIDEEDVIRESYMQLRNGEVIPIDIARIVTRNPDSNTGENNG